MLVILKTTLKTASGTFSPRSQPQEVPDADLKGMGPEVFVPAAKPPPVTREPEKPKKP